MSATAPLDPPDYVAMTAYAARQARHAGATDAEVLTAVAPASDGWPAPTLLPEGLPPVASFDGELLPSMLREYVADIAERMQCPVDFPAVAAMVTISSIVGRRCLIAPKRADSWTVVPNLWGMIVGRPGVMKSPPLQDVLRPLRELQDAAIRQHDSAMQEYEAAEVMAAERQKVQREAIRRALKKGDTGDASDRAAHLVEQAPEKPARRRYIVNDATVEKLGELLRENSNGLLQFRDELTGFFRTLERQGHEADRAFYLEAWNGDNSFTYDRIGRGTVHIPAACLAMLGGIQPGPLAEIMRASGAGGDDGLIQRFQLAVYPDVFATWRNVDRLPDHAARAGFDALIARLDSMATNPEPLRFDAQAQDLFDNWRAALEIRLRDGSEHPAMEAHLAKYRSLVPSLALLLHLAEQDAGPVELLALEQAIGWAEYLESHARRIYAPAVSPDMDAARLLADKITRGEIASRFTLRDVYRNGWSGLATVDAASAAVRVLADFDWLRAEQVDTAGRPRTDYLVNPTAMPKEQAA